MDGTLFLSQQNAPHCGHGKTLQLMMETRQLHDPREVLGRVWCYNAWAYSRPSRHGEVPMLFVPNNAKLDHWPFRGSSSWWDFKVGEVADYYPEYYLVLRDNTTDDTLEDQISQILRGVHMEGQNVKVKKCFIDLIHVKGRNLAYAFETAILQKLKNDGQPVSDCRTQGYDNALTMPGRKSGVQRWMQSRIQKLFCSLL